VPATTTDPSTETSGATSELLQRFEPALAELRGVVTDVVLLLRDDVPRVANSFARRFPGATVRVLGARRELTPEESAELDERVDYVLATSQQARVDYLMRTPRPQVVIDAGNKKRSHKLSSFRQLFYFIRPGGCYGLAELDACKDPRYDDAAGENVLDLLTEVVSVRAMATQGAEQARVMVQELAAASGDTVFRGSSAVVWRSEVSHFLKLRDWEADEVLDYHHPQGWGEVLLQRPGFTFASRATLESHGDGPIPSGPKTFEVPDRYLRRYRDVTCTARQIARIGDLVLPDSWRHPHQRVLNNRQLIHSSPFFGRYLSRTAPTTTEELPGSFYYLDTELPGHFGHITTDVISRVWGWELARREDPSVRPLVSKARDDDEGLPGYQQQIFTALGIPVDEVKVIGPREAVVVETLYGPTPQLENPHYVDPELADVWARLGERLPAGRPSQLDKIFISRRPSTKRHCHQTPEIEAFFASAGFTVLFPEDHSYVDQKMIFARARVIAGLGGSGMFNMMFNPRATVVIISGSSYNAHNEHLIAAANGNELHYFWGRSEIPMPPDRHSRAAFESSFTFDVRRHRRALRKIIA
jgi:capsular polysaccharide biosynthesis protein